jgi:phage tail-like protein
MTGTVDTFLRAHQFEVVISPSGADGDRGVAATASFSDVSGLEFNLEFEDLREGGYNWGVRKLVSKASSPALVLKRGMTHDTAFWDWIQSCVDGTYPLPYVDGTILVHGYHESERAMHAAVWAFHRGVVTKVSAAALDASGSAGVPIEELHIVHEGLERLKESEPIE